MCFVGMLLVCGLWVFFWGCLIQLLIDYHQAPAHADGYLPLWICRYSSAVRCDTRLRRGRGCIGRENNKKTGGSVSVLRRAVALFCLPLVVFCVGVARCALIRDE
ncbi:trans-sialidase [Trypanosoma cruzi]|nr:trans-sialidase [Trypanosoma cruzi]